MAEVWKDVSGYEGRYQVSNHGNVISLDRETVVNSMYGPYIRKVEGRMLKQHISCYGYPRVKLSTSKVEYICIDVHRLVAEAFVPNPNNHPQVNHKDSIRSNNYYANLEWVTPQENSIHSVVHNYTGRKNQKLRAIQIPTIRKLINEGTDFKTIAAIYNVSYITIYHIARNNSWKHIKEEA